MGTPRSSGTFVAVAVSPRRRRPAYCRWHRGAFASASGQPNWPVVPWRRCTRALRYMYICT